ncbi:MAG: hypothetical protein ACM338_07075, partial [Betaproteobacteria bacterium]
MNDRGEAHAPARAGPRDAAPSPEQALAERVGRAMFAKDAASQALGMRIESIAPGRAELAMAVRPDMLNG